MKKYTVVKIKEETLKIDGTGTNSIWEKAKVLDDFCSPWDPDTIKKIEFKALWDSENLYFNFKVYDNKVHLITKDNSNDSIDNSDRVELFFRSNHKMTPYYCLEIDPKPRLMDFKALPGKVFDFDWNWPSEDIKVKSLIRETDFCVEGTISLKSLTKYNLLKHGIIETGVYRAKYNQISRNHYEPIWITWVNPKTETPNFHTPSSFGEFILEGY
ncbi:sugar-binding protein [Tamlana sp. 2201CG12-4]|uniref:sugar-binding protein n=1 Tax=Tamlana sp. 2201CG12-4 TaxID=3112582 RepID=UPI002DBD9684|nr:sugar-binding protein [Tamlana sp. 2201CG12-4]MEC3908243.1 sugar-binding protein [Tamlana sp. 2201CG12-4]